MDAYIKSKCAETQIGKNLLILFDYEMDAIDGRNYQLQIQKKCENFVDACIKSISC